MRAHKLIFPAKVLDQHVIALGKTGAGKSSAIRHIVEHLLERGKRVCVLDPKGDWWGLKTSADGRGAGFPVIMFGDFKEPRAQDVPINDRSGKQVAELIATGNRPCVIGMRGWTQGAMTRFWVDFAQTIFAMNAGELYLVGDEFHNFAPKQWTMASGADNQAGVGLHWANRLLSEGRGLGIVCILASQRPQKVHNDTLTSCETLIAMRVIHAADRQAYKVWLDGAGDATVEKNILTSVAEVERGEAYVWSPEIKYGPERVKFPMFVTFDSFAPPQVQKKVSAAGWAGVNLDEVKEKLAAVIEEEKAKDPKALRARIGELERELAKAQAAKPVDDATVELMVKDEANRRLAAAVKVAVAKRDDEWEVVFHSRFETLKSNICGAVNTAVEPRLQPPPLDWVGSGLGDLMKVAESPVRSKPLADWPGRSYDNGQTFTVGSSGDVDLRSTPIGHGEGDPEVTAGLRRVLSALAQRNGLTNKQLGTRAGIPITSSTFRAHLAKGRSKGWIRDEGETRYITEAGIVALGTYTPLPTGRALLKHWVDEFGANSGEGRALLAIAGAYPNQLDYESIASAAGTAVTSSTFRAYMAKLRKLELIDGKGGSAKASDEFFTAGAK